MCNEPIHIFFAELGCQHCMPGKFWTWSVSLGHPVLLIQQQRWNTRAKTTVILGEGKKKSSAALHSDLDIIAWINSIIFIQISPAIDQQCLCLKLICLSQHIKAVYCILPLKPPCISVALCACVTSKLSQELTSTRWKTDLGKSTLQQHIGVYIGEENKINKSWSLLHCIKWLLYFHL